MKTKINIPRSPTELKEIESLMSWKKEHDEDDFISDFCIMDEEALEAVLYKTEFSSGKFKRCRFTNSNFNKTSFVDVVFENCDFSNSSFSEAYFCRCEFRNCKCLGADFCQVRLKHVSFADCVFRYANLNGAFFEFVHMMQCDFTETAMSEIAHKKWSAKDCQFVETNFFRTMLRGFDLSENEMADLVVSDTMEEMKGCKISPVQALEAAKLLGMEVL